MLNIRTRGVKEWDCNYKFISQVSKKATRNKHKMNCEIENRIIKYMHKKNKINE